MSLRGIKARLLSQNQVRLSTDFLSQAVARHHSEAWFVYAHTQRAQRQHVCWPSLWIASRLAASSAIFESGCGCGLNLIWFAQHGFKNLFGSDIDKKALSVAVDLFDHARVNAMVWPDDGLNPRRMGDRKFDALLALNWTYHVAEFELGPFIAAYRPYVRPSGYFAIDTIDKSYDTVPNNQYLTSDWTKPEEVRRPSEYKHRYSRSEVEDLAAQNGFCVVAFKAIRDVIPRNTCILKREKNDQH